MSYDIAVFITPVSDTKEAQRMYEEMAIDDGEPPSENPFSSFEGFVQKMKKENPDLKATPDETFRMIWETSEEQYKEIEKPSLSKEEKNFEQFFNELTTHYPDKNGVWSVSPRLGGKGIVLRITWNKYKRVVPDIVKLSEKYGLDCYDPQESSLLV